MSRSILSRVAAELIGFIVVTVGLLVTAQRFTAGGARVWIAVAVALALYVVATLAQLRWPRRETRRFVAYLSTVSAVLAALMLVALSYRVYRGVEPLTASFPTLLGTLAALAAVALLLVRAVQVIRALVIRPARWPALVRFAQGKSWSFPLILLALTVLWAPVLALLAPGSTTYDGTRQLNEILGASIPELGFTYVPSNHHPWFATVWQGALLSAGMGMSGGDINAGLAVHSIVLVSASLLTYAAVIHRIQSLTNRGWMLAALAFFAAIPHFANYAMLYEKTGWYQLALIWFFLGVVDVALRRGSGMTQALQLIGGGALAALFRSNGLYIVVPTLIVLALCVLRREDRRRLLVTAASLVAVLALFFGWTSAVLPRLGVVPASPGEALVVPFQQVARIVVEHGDELTPEQRAAIDAVMPIDEIRAAYDPENGDGVKGLYEIDSFLITDTGIRKMQDRGEWWNDPTVSADRNAFLAAWFQLIVQHPGTALSATVNNSYLYFAPPLNRGEDISLFTGGLPGYFVLANEYTGDYRHTAGEPANQLLVDYYRGWATTPGLNMLVNPGLYGWIVIALGISLAFWPRRERLMIFAPVVLIYLINFAGARNGDFRYTVPLVALVPICLAAWFAMAKFSGHPKPAD
ncbi:DUF6020 family protein [Microbacterium sp. P04]|uniref:DUF6020 family protein n=1 Tax=Microbacterium sp. P04 TaxID=3366947 RepID=UPI003746811D